MNPTSLITKHDAAVNNRGRAPDRTAGLVLPNNFAFVGGQAIKVMIASPDIDLSIEKGRAGPDSNMLARNAWMSAIGFDLPNQLTTVLSITAYDTVFGSGVYESASDCRRGI